ncbi:hypothetical protein MMC13_004448 [Lambiella insularis]|nr:hypothetical protein [Lambiella insularis]
MLNLIKQIVLAVPIYIGWQTPQLDVSLQTNDPKFCLPNPTGPYNVGVQVHELHDKTRRDPFASYPCDRVVMLSVFYPAAVEHDDNDEKVPICESAYMPDRTAEVLDQQFQDFGVNRSFAWLYTPAKVNASLFVDNAEDFPVVLISHGAGAERFFYTTIAESIASNGYVVASIDHPYDSAVVELLNGTLIRGPLDIPNRLDLLWLDLETRVNDSSFALDELSKMPFFRDHGTNSGGLNVSKTGIMGHSLGGATASQAMAMDTRMAAGISLDGPFWGSMNVTGLDRPILVMGAEGHDGTGMRSPWKETWPKLRAWKRQLNIKGTVHNSFTDFPALVDLFGIRQDLPDGGADIVGLVKGKRMLEIESAYITAFFDMFLKGKNSTLFDEEDTTYPEVVTIQD